MQRISPEQYVDELNRALQQQNGYATGMRVIFSASRNGYTMTCDCHPSTASEILFGDVPTTSRLEHADLLAGAAAIVAAKFSV
jgi:hypothetical protein